jgi:rhomboid family GlyGly-CTERM serine protease
LAGQFWRLWTGHLVHFSVQHATFDIIAMFFLCKMAEREVGTYVLSWALLVSAPMISIILCLTVPNLMFYRGLSGLTVFVGVAVGISLWRRAPRLHAVLTLLGSMFIGKFLFDVAQFSVLSSVPSGIRIVWQAHAIGGILGALAVSWDRRLLNKNECL